MVLMVFFSSRISPFTSTVIFFVKSPMATAVVFWIFWLSAGQHRVFPEDAVWQVVRMIVQPLIYLPLVAWGGFYCGLKCKSQTQAMLLGSVILGVLVGVPRILLPFLASVAPANDIGYVNGVWMNISGTLSPQDPQVNFFAYPVQLIFHCSNYFEFVMLPDRASTYYGRLPIPVVMRIVEILHWFLYGFAVLALRMRAPLALTRSSQRAEAPVEELALEPV